MFHEELLDGVHQVHTFIYGHCNVVVSKIRWVGNYRYIYSWIDRYVIAYILIVSVIKCIYYSITYNIDDGYYEVPNGDVAMKFYKDGQKLPWIDVRKQGVLIIHKVRKNY